MIAHLTGKIRFKTPTQSVIDCNGVGYEINHTPFCAEALHGENASVFVHTQVREDAIQLFAFVDVQERDLFRELLKVNGIGPKMAISILSGMPASDLIGVIQSKDLGRLQKIPGIGRKTAERISIELADRLKGFASSHSTSPQVRSETAKESELESVLLNLGYQKAEITRAIQHARKREEPFDQLPLETMVKTTLKELMQGRPV